MIKFSGWTALGSGIFLFGISGAYAGTTKCDFNVLDVSDQAPAKVETMVHDAIVDVLSAKGIQAADISLKTETGCTHETAPGDEDISARDDWRYTVRVTGTVTTARGTLLNLTPATFLASKPSSREQYDVEGNYVGKVYSMSFFDTAHADPAYDIKGTDLVNARTDVSVATLSDSKLYQWVTIEGQLR